MAPSKQQMEKLALAADEGDSDAAAAHSDALQETGPDPYLNVGQLVMIYSATHFFCGKLIAENHEYYVLAPGSVQVFETGPYSSFYKEGIATNCDSVPVVRRVRKGGVINIDDWSLKTLPRSK